MNKLIFIFLAVVLYFLGTIYFYGQGCSDAGICTMHSFKPNSTDSTETLNNQFKIGAFFGNADNSILVYGNYFEYNQQLSDEFGIDAKLSTLAQSGNGISVIGLSDIFLNASYRAIEKVKLTFGVKIPLSKSDKSFENLPLPMDYQTSLGTWDLIFGIGYEIGNIQLVAAIQHPLSQNNNQFFAFDYPNNSDLKTFQSTNKFQRSGDVLLRLSYPLTINSSIKLTPSILPIYHLTNDKYEDENNLIREIKGSQGLTLNGNIYLDYEINSQNIIQLNIGMPFIVREARPDGLTRSFIANLEYRVKF